MNYKIKKILMESLIILCVCLLLWSAANLIIYYTQTKKANDIYNEAQNSVQIQNSPHPTETTSYSNEEDIIQTEPVDIYADLKVNIDINWSELKSQAKDLVGWVYIPESNINYPLVQKDNQYYLEHDYQGNKNSAGSIFVQQGQTMDDKNLIIYGHHMKADIMFHRLTYYAAQDYADAHKYIYISTENETRLYQVFSVIYTKNTSDTYTYEFDETQDFGTYIQNAVNNSIVATEHDISINDKILTLSTCTGREKTERLVVHAVLLTTY